MKALISLLMPLLGGVLSQKPAQWSKRCMAYFFGAILLPVAYVLGCVSLYYYLLPLLGVAFSLLAVGGLVLATSLVFFIAGWFFKPKKTALSKANAVMETALSQITTSRLPLAALLAVGAIALYFSTSKNKDNRF